MNTITIDNLGLPQKLSNKIHHFATNVEHKEPDRWSHSIFNDTEFIEVINALKSIEYSKFIQKKMSENTSSDYVNKSTCSCSCCHCNINYEIPYTCVKGTYKFSHRKWRSYDYYICPICMYLAVNNEAFSNYLSACTTNDRNGKLKYKNNQWVIVHPSIDKNKYEEMMEDGEYIDEIFCDF